MGRQITETVQVSMSYEEYQCYDAIARELKLNVPEVLLRLAAIGIEKYVRQTYEN